ncbi:MAG TPA: hypothetical protein VLG92_02350 [Candidatus Saccharimonadia bacterium]|nr:hypothetical protein [Candidatus Saccharimonadia bacterium]
MEADKDKKPDEAANPSSSPQSAPPDALEKTNEELGQSAASETAVNADGSTATNGKPAKKQNPLKQFLKRFNVYLLLFGLVVLLAVVVSVVGFLNGKKTPKTPSANTQTLSADTLKQLANSDATVGDTGQTLTIQGNAIFSGQVLIRSDLNVAGTIKLGGELSIPALTVSNTSNLNTVQANTLQVAQGSTFQGTVTIQHDLNVGGAAAFSGAVTIGQLTVNNLTMAGNAQLTVPNHIAFTGASPGRQFFPNVTGAGGSASINGSDTTGTINVNTGSGPTAGCFMTITFNRPFTNTPHVLVSPVNIGAGQTEYYVTRSTTQFSICTANAPPANSVMAYDYFITD